jgi:excisionase family DNA binding protein
MNEPPKKLLVSSREAAKLLSISERTLWTLTKNGQIGCVRIGTSKRYAVAELERFIASAQTSEATPQQAE